MFLVFGVWFLFLGIALEGFGHVVTCGDISFILFAVGYSMCDSTTFYLSMLLLIDLNVFFF